MAMAMIVLKNTPKGFKLIPVSEVRDGQGIKLSKSDPMALRCGEIMDFLIVEAKLRGIYRTTIADLFGLLLKKFGDGFFDDCKVLPASGSNPARLLVKNDR